MEFIKSYTNNETNNKDDKQNNMLLKMNALKQIQW